MEIRAVTVKQLNLYVKSLFEGDSRLQSVAVTGELSNFKRHYASGHLYFTLKDESAAVRCVMFRSFTSCIPFEPKDGMKVVLVGRISLYEKDGQYQFYAEQMLPAGVGELALKFEQTKAKLEAEGLFAPENKRPIPKFPQKIAVVTSNTGAALKDILNILSRRWPIAEIILCHASVQGQLAVPEMLEALNRIYALGTAELIIIGRGGGSAEDLSEFNSELLARKLCESPVPVISAVGHETDFSISDFVADMRAPTPSAAAELAVPDRFEIYDRLDKYQNLFKARLNSRYAYCSAKFSAVEASTVFKKPLNIINSRAEQTDRTADRLLNAVYALVDSFEARLLRGAVRLDALSPMKVLTRGYTVAAKDGKTVSDIDAVNVGDDITLSFANGRAVCKITEKERLN